MTGSRSTVLWGWGGITKWHEEASEIEGKICSLDCANSFMGVYICLMHIVYFRYVQFIVCQLYPKKDVLKWKERFQ